MDQTQLMIELSRIQGARFLSVTSATETRMNKTNGGKLARVDFNVKPLPTEA